MASEESFVNDANERLKNASLRDVLTESVSEFKEDLVLASSCGLEDQVLTHALLQVEPNATIVVLDTGRLNQETYDVMAKTMETYDFKYRVYFPNHDSVEDLVRSKGPNSFYESVENRKNVAIYEGRTLSRALDGKLAWITGIRRDQSVTRQKDTLFEHDKAHDMIKINPLIEWSLDDVWTYIREHKVPYNVLHDQGYPSIGCAPCKKLLNQAKIYVRAVGGGNILNIKNVDYILWMAN